jgi:integrase
VHLQVIAGILGHSDIRVTSAVYPHVGEQLQRDAADRMAGALDW